MSQSTIVIALGIYILIMGIVGYIRTKSPTAIGFNGAFGVVCIILGSLLEPGSSGLLLAAQVWVGLIAVTSIIMGTRRLMAPKRAVAPILIFATMAIFALYTLWILARAGGAAQAL